MNNLKQSKYMQRFIMLTFLFCASCSKEFKIKNSFSKYQKTFIEKSKYAPNLDQINKDRRVNVVVLDFDFSGISDNNDQKIPISQYAASKIESILNSTGYIKVLDRNISKKAHQEIQLKEAGGNFTYAGPAEAQYAIYGKISNLTFSSEFDARTGANFAMKAFEVAATASAVSRGGIYINAGRDSSIPGVYKYTLVVEGEIKIIDLKTLQEVVKIPFKNIEYRTENASTPQGDLKPAKTFDLQMATSGMEKVLMQAKRTILNTIPIVSYIEGRMDIGKDEKPIFRINAGSGYGIKQKWNVGCELVKEQTNDLTGKVEVEKDIVAGYTTDVIYPDYCWIMLDDYNVAQNIKLGDRCLLSPDIRKLDEE